MLLNTQIDVFALTEAIKTHGGRRETYICTISNILCKDFQRNGLRVILLFPLTYATAFRGKQEGERSVL